VTTQPDTDAPPTDAEFVAAFGPLSDSSRPPTTPQTEAGGWFDPVTGDGYAPDQPRPSKHAEHDRCYWAGYEEGKRAAAGALPSVERMTEAVRAVVPFPNTWRSTDDAARRYAEMILARLAAAPPEASER
jgi:hypothetical protein